MRFTKKNMKPSFCFKPPANQYNQGDKEANSYKVENNEKQRQNHDKSTLTSKSDENIQKATIETTLAFSKHSPDSFAP